MLYEYQALASPRPLGLKDMGVSLPHRYADASGTRVASLDTDPIMSWVYPPGTLWVWDTSYIRPPPALR